jgi:hypothetical protein
MIKKSGSDEGCRARGRRINSIAILMRITYFVDQPEGFILVYLKDA